ncbi:MAG: large repetitive protein [Acidobacteriota bacterium]|jgi:hypothetical protein|nr:large repetitive protein [Acidobacteriota bacterium]
MREVLRPVFRSIGEMPVITAKGGRLTIVDKARRFFIQDTLTHPGVKYSPVGRMLKKAFPRLRLQQHHAIIQKAWYRLGGPSQWYAGDRHCKCWLSAIGRRGMESLVPIAATFNNLLGRTSVGTAAFAGGVYGGVRTLHGRPLHPMMTMMATSSSKEGQLRLRYHGTADEVRLADRVLVKRLLRKPIHGTVTYMPGVSPSHDEMEWPEFSRWAIELGARRFAYLRLRAQRACSPLVPSCEVSTGVLSRRELFIRVTSANL